MITGSRLAPGGAQARYGVQADITVLGKALGAGMPISAVSGSAAMLEPLVAGRLSQRGTFNGHPLSVAAGNFNGDNYPDLALVNNFSPGTVTILINAADWGGGQAAVPARRLHARRDAASALFLASSMQSLRSLPVVPANLPPSSAPQAPLDTHIGQPVDHEASASRPRFTVRHPQDAVFEKWEMIQLISEW